MAAEPSTDSLAGQLVGGRYRIMRRVGKGGMGAVYEAEHVGLDKRVAVKFLLDRFNDDREVVERFHREAKTASRIGHEHIIEVTDVGDDGNRPFIVMELLEGGDLSGVLAASGPMPPARAVHVIKQVLRGLEAAHDKGIVHRDMKPENVFLIRRGADRDFVKVMDFGISKVIAANDSKVRLTQTGAVIGTPIYMAPEQALAQGELDHRVDLYAIGVMLFELLAGRPPFMAQNYLGLVTQHLNTPPPSLAGLRPDLPPSLVAAVHRALEKDPDKRFQTCGEFFRALPSTTMLRDLDGASTLGDTDGVRVITEGSQAARAVVRPDTVGADVVPRRRPLAMWILGGAVLAAAAMVAIAMATRDQDRPAPAAEASEHPGSASASAQPAPDVVSLGELDVRSTPAGAKVYLDDDYHGTAPIRISELPVGSHRLRLELEGHVTVSKSVNVNGGKSNVVDEAMAALDGAPIVKTGSGSGSGKTSGVAKGSSKGSAKAGAIRGSGSGSASASAVEDRPPGDGGSKGSSKGSSHGRPGHKPNPYD